MSRKVRPNLPGHVFHLVTRVQWREQLLDTAVRTSIVTALRLHARRWDGVVLAYAVMPNHLHLVVRQGERPLGALMQPLLRRIASIVQRACGREGHVFERRYRHRLCAGDSHTRNAIVYVHLNPVRAGLVTDPVAYAWSSHCAYTGQSAAVDGDCHPIHASLGLCYFAAPTSRRMYDLRCGYLDFMRWRLAEDARRFASDASASQDAEESLDESCLLDYADPMNDPPWLAGRTGAEMALVAVDLGASPERDASDCASLETIVTQMVERRLPGARLDVLCSRWGGRAYASLRRHVVRAAVASGYPQVEVARFLRLSESAVSRILSRHRRGGPPD